MSQEPGKEEAQAEVEEKLEVVTGEARDPTGGSARSRDAAKEEKGKPITIECGIGNRR